ncbi:MAG: DUF4276 family protein [Magnetococcales bacterium]|nr:DUF4276 family protein [Magnetococcales bacterium]
MPRLNILVEGQTEEAFVNGTLAPHLMSRGVTTAVRCICRKRKRTRENSGGIVPFESFRKDLNRWMGEDRGAYFTSMVDLYALPRDWPGFDEAALQAPYEKVEVLEKVLDKTINCGDQWGFLPYIQLHEFEALLFSDPRQFAWEFVEHEQPIKALMGIVQGEDNPELINDGIETAPSKRIIKLLPEYEDRKVSAGASIAERIGLPLLREKCRHFHEWLSQLEKLGSGAPT